MGAQARALAAWARRMEQPNSTRSTRVYHVCYMEDNEMSLHRQAFSRSSEDPLWWWCIPCGMSNRGEFCANCGRQRRDATDEARWRRFFSTDGSPDGPARHPAAH